MAITGGFIVVYNHIPALIAYVESQSRMAVKTRADEIASRARMLAPVRTGYLRTSIEAYSTGAGKEAEVRVGAPYAAYVEYGTVHMAAQPFLTPAAMDVAPEFFADVGKWFVRF